LESSRSLAIVTFVSVWAAAVALSGFTFPTNGASADATAQNPNTRVVSQVISIGIGSALLLASLFVAGFLVRSILDLYRRKDDEHLGPEREKPRPSWTDYLLLVVAVISSVLVIRWVLIQCLPGTGLLQTTSQRPSELSPKPLPMSHTTSGRPAPAWQIGVPAWVLLAGLGVSAFGIVALAWRGKFLKGPDRNSPANAVEEIARDAGEKLLHGADIGDTVLACYRDMCAALADTLRIQAHMTPGEFADRLFERGFPIRHVIVLTRLFERVRYGHETLREEERERARETLKAIQVQAQKGTR